MSQNKWIKVTRVFGANYLVNYLNETQCILHRNVHLNLEIRPFISIVDELKMPPRFLRNGNFLLSMNCQSYCYGILHYYFKQLKFSRQSYNLQIVENSELCHGALGFTRFNVFIIFHYYLDECPMDTGKKINNVSHIYNYYWQRFLQFLSLCSERTPCCLTTLHQNRSQTLIRRPLSGTNRNCYHLYPVWYFNPRKCFFLL